MDSMRNLSTSLPSSSRRRLDQPELLMDFKAAALSVTNLYKSAVSVQAKARAIGYQDALDDLLGFLDKEEMGLMDGEGWRVRRWATERLDEGGVEREGEGSGDEVEPEVAKDDAPLVAAGTRSSSPEAQRKAVVPREGSEDSGRIEPEPPVLQLQQRQHTRSPTPTPPQHTAHQHQQHTVPTAETFTFRSSHAYPNTNTHDRERETGTSMDLDTTSQQSHMSSSTPPSSSDATLRHYPHPRPSRNHRHTNHNRQRGGDGNVNGRAGTGTISLNLSANNGKRKMPYPDFFDISGVNFDGNDGRRDGSGNGRGAGGGGGGGGGKRGRHV
ncbi:hypothetical protein LTR10_001066 [Elasticomyces elasticus]|nr:hypothetical protein LTR10_001066 [Elasticomyces elasticus]KAK4965569.1 hypothetical protein LTR42_012325 [Elasticomyces elasticus]